MSIRHHPRDETLLAYAAGTQVAALSAVIACHLAVCGRCRAEVRRMELIAGALLEREAEQDLSRKAVERTLALLPRVAPEARDTDVRTRTDAVLPKPLARHLDMGIADIPWRELARGIEQFKIKLARRGGDLRLLRVQAGRKLLRHGHYGSELTLVLKGSYRDETGEYRVGEVADLDEDIEHRPTVTEEGECICIIAGESYPRYNSVKVRLLRPFLGL